MAQGEMCENIMKVLQYKESILQWYQKITNRVWDKFVTIMS